MIERIPNAPPKILPLPLDVERPLWSVMIPAYNCIQYLGETIESVLAQDPGEALMQIDVVDDCSTDGDVEGLVYRLGGGRVGYYRQPQNCGSLRNFETCINRARGHWVHILHGDDKVKPGFYNEIKYLFDQYPQAGAAFTRHMVMTDKGEEFIKVNPQVGEVGDRRGIIDNWLLMIAQRNRLQPPPIVVRRTVYEDVGSFFAVFFGEDWEMWVRIAAKYPVAYSPKRLALYRLHHSNITARSFSSGQTLKDLKKVISIIKQYLPEDKREELHQKALQNASRYIIGNAYKAYLLHKNKSSLLTQVNGAFKMYPSRRNFYRLLKVYVKLCLPFWKGRKQPLIKHESEPTVLEHAQYELKG